jgi:hypothetical protein
MKIVLTICYNNAYVTQESVNRYYEMCYERPDLHILVDNEYPLGKEKSKEMIKTLAEKYNCLLLEPKVNLGMKKGITWALEQAELKNDDKIMFYDSNAYPLTKNFDKALFDIIDGENIVTAALTIKSNNKVDKFKDERTGHYYYIFNTGITGSSVMAFTYDLQSILKGSNIYNYSDTYGDGLNHNEVRNKMNEILLKLNKKAVLLCDFNEQLDFFKLKEDKLYVSYKKLMPEDNTFKNVNFEDYITNPEKYDKLSKVNKNIKIYSGEFYF